MAYNSGTAPSIISKTEYNIMSSLSGACISSIKFCEKHRGILCMFTTYACNLTQVTPIQLAGYNLYDIREKCKHPPLCYDFSNEGKYLNSDKVKAALGVNKQWSSCNMSVNLMFQTAGDWWRDMSVNIPQMLKDGIRVMIYAGDQDFICNWLGNQAWTLNMEWEGKDEFNKANNKEWHVENTPAGKIRLYEGDKGHFSFIQVYKAGHMVPMNQGKNSEQMLYNFI